MERITFFSSGACIVFITSMVISLDLFAYEVTPLLFGGPGGEGWDQIPPRVIPIPSARIQDFQTWVIIAQFQVTKDFIFMGHKRYWNFNPRHFTIPLRLLNPHRFIILDVEVCSYSQVTKGLLLEHQPSRVAFPEHSQSWSQAFWTLVVEQLGVKSHEHGERQRNELGPLAMLGKREKDGGYRSEKEGRRTKAFAMSNIHSF